SGTWCSTSSGGELELGRAVGQRHDRTAQRACRVLRPGVDAEGAPQLLRALGLVHVSVEAQQRLRLEDEVAHGGGADRPDLRRDPLRLDAELAVDRRRLVELGPVRRWMDD